MQQAQLRMSRGVTKDRPNRMTLERSTVDGDSPVGKMIVPPAVFPSTAGHEESCRNPGGPSPKAKYSSVTDSEPVP